MDPDSRRIPASAGIPPHFQGGATVIVAAPGWRRAVRDAERVAARAARAAGADATVMLSGDRAVQRLNARHRGRNKPTNVLTFEPAAPGAPGDIVLALGVVLREAREAGKRPAAHLAHLVVHGALHLQGHDHHEAGPARRMELAEARILRRLGVANPWRRR
jgi:probable rRNA maturation factor